MKAFLVTIKSWEEAKIIVAAKTRGQAISKQFSQAREAGFSYSFIDFRAVRSPEYDHLIDDVDAAKPCTLGWTDGRHSFGCMAVHHGN